MARNLRTGTIFAAGAEPRKAAPFSRGEIVIEVPQVVPQMYTPYSNAGATVQAKVEPMYLDDRKAGNVCRSFAVFHVIFEFANLIVACTFAATGFV